jgi:hypothetical protein
LNVTVKQEGPSFRFTVPFPVDHRGALPAYEAGFVLGVLIGEGHFGGDAHRPQVTLRMHVRHEPLLRALHRRFPRARLYGPYEHDGRRYFQLMWRGPALLYDLMPLLEALPWAEIDPHSFARYAGMKERYGLADIPSFGLRKVVAMPDVPFRAPPDPPLDERTSSPGL